MRGKVTVSVREEGKGECASECDDVTFAITVRIENPLLTTTE